ncbi:MAG: division/cell wall cluster transcriptional repressor MraZ [Candidatus Brocadiia bacterium]
MFLGAFSHSLDTESRLALPARLRETAGEDFADGLCLVCGAEPCILACSRGRLGELMRTLRADPSISSTAAREFKRALGSRAAVVVPDRQGRILIPELLREHAGIRKEVTVVGAVDSIEIWDTEKFRERQAVRDAAYERLAQRVLG